MVLTMFKLEGIDDTNGDVDSMNGVRVFDDDDDDDDVVVVDDIDRNNENDKIIAYEQTKHVNIKLQ